MPLTRADQVILRLLKRHNRQQPNLNVGRSCYCSARASLRLSKPSWRKRLKINIARLTVEDEFGHCFTRRWGVQHAPDAMSRCHEHTFYTRNASDDGQSVPAEWAKAGLCCHYLSLVQARRQSLTNPL